jgi:hypothetical protein
MEKIGFYLDLMIKDSGIALYLVILFGGLLIAWLIRHKVKGGQSKVKKVQPNFLDTEDFEN